jgi:spore coat polysaccharide biosynthesis protein SpsF
MVCRRMGAGGTSTQLSETGIIIFARLDSNRLPGKALLPIHGRAILGRVIDRAKRVKNNFPIVVATSSRKIDDEIADFVGREGVQLFRGATDDVAGRAYDCARHFGFRQFVRISGDSPFFDTEMVSQLVALHLADDLDLTTNVAIRTYPPGSSVEVIATAAMKKLLAATSDAEDREHVTRYFYQARDAFRVSNIAANDGQFTDVSLVVDTPDDFERAIWLVANAGDDPVGLAMEAYAALAAKWPGKRTNQVRSQ